MSHRRLKRQTLSILQSNDWPAALDALRHYPPRQVVNPLFGLLFHAEPLVRWRTVTAMGVVVSQLANRQMESARVIMRRLMWNLNDESGGIGWGSPESLGEIMAKHEGLAQEYGCILVSYADPAGNLLEHPILQRGVLWGWGRLGRVQPSLFQSRAHLLKPFLLSPDHHLRGLATWAAKPLQSVQLQGPLTALLHDAGQVVIYSNQELTLKSIGHLAQCAIA